MNKSITELCSRYINCAPQQPPVADSKLYDRCNEHICVLENLLSQEQCRLLDEFALISSQQEDALFVSGFTLGMRVALECIYGD